MQSDYGVLSVADVAIAVSQLKKGIGSLVSIGIFFQKLFESGDGAGIVFLSVSDFTQPVDGVVGSLLVGEFFQKLIEFGFAFGVFPVSVELIGICIQAEFVLHVVFDDDDVVFSA